MLSQKSDDGEDGAAADGDFKNGGERCTTFQGAFPPLSFGASTSQGGRQGLFLMTEEREGATSGRQTCWVRLVQPATGDSNRKAGVCRMTLQWTGMMME